MPLSPISAAVIAHGGRVLLVRRSAPAGALLWKFPSGKVGRGETAGQAAAREAMEEAGVVVPPPVIMGERAHPDTGRWVVYVVCQVISSATELAATVGPACCCAMAVSSAARSVSKSACCFLVKSTEFSWLAAPVV